MSDDDRLIVTQYRDPITSQARTVTTCAEHSNRLLRVLRAAGVGCSSTYSPSFLCDPCENEEANKARDERDKNKRAAVTLGKIVDRQCRDVLDATGMHHVIGEDGDGDWALVWERLAEIGAWLKAIDEPPNEAKP